MTTDLPPWERRWPRGPAFRRRRFLLPVVIGVIEIGVAAELSGHHGVGTLSAAGALALLVGAGALVFRRSQPVPVLFVVLAATFAADVAGVRGPIFLALIVAVAGAVLRGHRVAAGISLLVGYGGFVWLSPLLQGFPGPDLAQALGVAAWLLVLFTIADTARGRRERAIEHATRHREERRRRASEERLRIAQELHDVLAHNISLMNVQAGVALHLLDEQPEQARTALAAIKEASNEALGELRSVLDILRQGDEAAPRSPTSGLADLDGLVARTRAAGVDVTSRVEGVVRPVPAGVDLAAYRIVQEALTNVTRHAGSAHATVVVEYGASQLFIRVDDDGVGVGAPSTAGGGNGIPGMTERAAALGGTLEAGPRPTGGFSVRATLPLPSEEGSA